MVARLWTAKANVSQYSAYVKYFAAHVVPQLKSIDGYLSCKVLTRTHNGVVEITVVTMWVSMEHIQGFSGPDTETAVVTEEAASLLVEYDRHASHYDIAFADPTTTEQKTV